jgi:hypothetical protein
MVNFMSGHRHHYHRHHHHHVGRWLFWPIRALWHLVSFILSGVGRLVAGVLGFTLLMVGVLLSLTVIGAIIGIPLALVGFLLLLRAIF